MFEMNLLSRDWAVGILKRQQTYFGEKFNKQWASVTENGNNLELLIESMQEVFEGLDELEIKRGLNTMRTKTFVPSLPEFRAWCRPENNEGWLSPDQAWAIAIESLDENKTIVWTDEIAQAFGFVGALLEMGDKFSAARAFKERYASLVDQAKAKGSKPRMYASLGHDLEMRQAAILQAESDGTLKITVEEKQELIGHYQDSKKPIAANVLEQLAKLRETLGFDQESASDRAAKLLQEQNEKRDRQIAMLQDRITQRHIDPYEDKEDYLESIKDEPTQQLNYGRIAK